MPGDRPTTRGQQEPPKRDARGRWLPGSSGGSPGRPMGSRHKATLAAEALLGGEAEGLTRKAVEMALAGDSVALRLCLERILPPRKERPVTISLQATGDLAAATTALLSAAAAGELTPGEAAALGGLVETHRKVIETDALVARIEELERRLARGGPAPQRGGGGEP